MAPRTVEVSKPRGLDNRYLPISTVHRQTLPATAENMTLRRRRSAESPGAAREARVCSLALVADHIFHQVAGFRWYRGVSPSNIDSKYMLHRLDGI